MLKTKRQKYYISKSAAGVGLTKESRLWSRSGAESKAGAGIGIH